MKCLLILALTAALVNASVGAPTPKPTNRLQVVTRFTYRGNGCLVYGAHANTAEHKHAPQHWAFHYMPLMAPLEKPSMSWIRVLDRSVRIRLLLDTAEMRQLALKAVQDVLEPQLVARYGQQWTVSAFTMEHLAGHIVEEQHRSPVAGVAPVLKKTTIKSNSISLTFSCKSRAVAKTVFEKLLSGANYVQLTFNFTEFQQKSSQFVLKVVHTKPHHVQESSALSDKHGEPRLKVAGIQWSGRAVNSVGFESDFENNFFGNDDSFYTGSKGRKGKNRKRPSKNGLRMDGNVDYDSRGDSFNVGLDAEYDNDGLHFGGKTNYDTESDSMNVGLDAEYDNGDGFRIGGNANYDTGMDSLNVGFDAGYTNDGLNIGGKANYDTESDSLNVGLDAEYNNGNGLSIGGKANYDTGSNSLNLGLNIGYRIDL